MLVISPVRLWDARCHQLGDRTVGKLSEALLFPMCVEKKRCPSPLSTGSRAESTSKVVAGTHSTGGLCSAPRHDSGPGKAPNPTLVLQTAKRDSMRGREKQPCSAQDERESV